MSLTTRKAKKWKFLFLKRLWCCDEREEKDENSILLELIVSNSQCKSITKLISVLRVNPAILTKV